jgi:hypothetical protein
MNTNVLRQGNLDEKYTSLRVDKQINESASLPDEASRVKP